MTHICVFRFNGDITGFEASGHAGFADLGEDIVCAAISALLQTAMLGLTDYLALSVATKIEDGFMHLSVDKSTAINENVKTIFNTTLLGLRSINEAAPDYLKITDRRCN